MKENEDKNMEQYVQKVIKETLLESPSHDFTAKVMANVLAMDKSNATVYKPLISKTGWIIIFGGIIATMVYFIINGGAQTGGHSWSFDLSGKDFIKMFSSLHLFQFSRVTVNVIVVSTILMFIQITLLKNYLNKRLTK
jgi:hypothetical protein